MTAEEYRKELDALKAKNRAAADAERAIFGLKPSDAYFPNFGYGTFAEFDRWRAAGISGHEFFPGASR